MSFLPPVSRRLFVAACALAVLGALRTSGSPEVKAQGFTLPYNYLPSPDITDGRFLAQAGTKMETLVGVGSDYEIYLDADQIQNGKWQLGIFDGDTGKNAAGTVTASFESGHWDWIKTMPTGGKEQLTYKLFEDPAGTVDPTTATPACTWLGNKPTSSYTCNAAYAGTTYSNSTGMADNDWFDVSLPANATRYRLYVTFATPGVSVESAFRLRSSGKITTVGGRPFQLLGAARRRLDYGVLYPNWDVTTYPGTPVLAPTNYNGEWSVYVELPAGEDRLDIWDGDLDHGSSNGQFGDTDDVDTLPSAIPPGGPYGNQAKPEAAMGKGAPSDDLLGVTQTRWRRGPAIEYTVYDPNATTYRNANPSGNREWEKFTVCETCSDKDYTAADLPAGLYEIKIQGYDLDNINALLLQQDSYVIIKNGDADLGNTVWYDTDNDGFKDPLESGISGVTVKVTRDVNLNDVADPGEPYWTDITDNSGLYLIENLADGQYVVKVQDGVGTPLQNFNLANTDNAHQVDLTANDQWSKDQSYIARITNETDNLTADFGYIAGGGQGGFKIGDTVFFDNDLDGTQDAGEPGIFGVVLNIYLDWDGTNTLAGDNTFDGDELLLGTATTDANGKYQFSVPFDGADVDYFVKVADSNSDDGGPLENTSPTVVGPDGATGASAAGPQVSRPIPYRARVWGEDNLTADFGYVPFCTPSTIDSNFNGTAIAAGNTIWFNSVVNPSNVPAGGGTLDFEAVIIKIVSGANTYYVNAPGAHIIFSTSATSSSTTFDATTNKWMTTVPAGYSNNIFLTGVGYVVPAGGLPGGANPVSWSGQLTTNMSGFGMQWQWAAAVYTTFNTNPAALGVKPIDANTNNPYLNSDHAGTPENYKQYVTGGARGGGGSNFTGSYSGTGTGTLCGHVIRSGDYCTYSKGAWGGNGMPAQLLIDHWSDIEGTLVLGTEDGAGSLHDATWTNLTNLRNWWSGGGTSGAFTQDYDNAESTSGGNLAKQTAAFAVSLKMSAAGFTGNGSGPLGDLYFCDGTGDSLTGLTLLGLLAAANNALAGNGLPSGYTFDQLQAVIAGMNIEAVHECTFGGSYADNLSLDPCS